MKGFLKSKLVLSLAAFLMIAAAIVIPLSGSITRSHAAANVLILSTTVTNGANSLEAQAAQAQGLTVNVVDPSTWGSMTTADFASYKAIILGDPTCQSDTSPIAPAEANTSTWGSAVKGNVVVIGTDPVFHAPSQIGAQTLIKNGIAFATSTPGKTGAYIDLSCYYAGASSGTSVPVLNGIASGGFTVVGQGGCPNNSHIVGTSSVLTGLTDASLSNWSCSTHEGFVTWPSSFQVLVISEDIPSSFVAPDGTTGAPYILARSTQTLPSQGSQPQLIFPFSRPSSSHPEDWVVINGYNDGFTHEGYNRYAFDLQRADSQGHACGDCTKDEPVFAAANGIVVFTEASTGCVALRHNQFLENSKPRWYFTIYCHLKTPFSVQPNQQVKQNDQIGLASNTHTSTTCSDPCPYHIHFSLFSAADVSANNDRRAEQPMNLAGLVVNDLQNTGPYPYPKNSWPSDGSTNQYQGWTIRRP